MGVHGVMGSPWGCKGSDRTERFHFHFSLSCSLSFSFLISNLISTLTHLLFSDILLNFPEVLDVFHNIVSYDIMYFLFYMYFI